MDARAGADSVCRFVERTAERVAEGCRWQTINYSNAPQYHYNAFNGCGGIGMFLADYGHITANDGAIELAREANRWCSTVQEGDFDDGHGACQRGLLTGRTGAALAWVRLAAVTGETVSDHAAANADIILTEDPGPVTDLMGGAASNGLFLLRLWEATEESGFLEGARRNGTWLCEQLTRDDDGCHCLCHVGGEFGDRPFLGVAHGISGVAHFLVLLHEATGDAQWAGVARDILQTLERHAVADRGGLNWFPRLGGTKLDRCQWSHGAAGIGIVFLRASRALNEPSYRKIALQAGETTYAYGDFRSNITQCIGLSGCGELFVELFRDTGDDLWLTRATRFADMALAYRAALPAGDAWPTDEPGLYSADFMYGASGLGHYFLRLLEPQTLGMPYM